MYEYKAKVINVVDGDTIDVVIDLGFDIKYSTRVRLYGINTPETRSRNKKEKDAGLKAKCRLTELLLNSEPGVIIRTIKDDSVEKYGRLLANIFLNGVNVNELLLQEGLAVPYFGKNK
jgi:micrococcal nuclease